MIRNYIMMKQPRGETPAVSAIKEVVYSVGNTSVDVTGKVASGDILIYIAAEYQRDEIFSTHPSGFTGLQFGTGTGTFEINHATSWKSSDGTETTIDGPVYTDTQATACVIIIEGYTSLLGYVSSTFTGAGTTPTITCSAETEEIVVVGIKMETDNPTLTNTEFVYETLNTATNPEFHIGSVVQTAGNAANITMTSADDGFGQWHIGFYVK